MANAEHNFLNDALDGRVVVNIGQITPTMKAVMDRAVRAGKLVAWKGKWFPVAGAHFGMGPNKTCWSTPEVAADLADMKRGRPRDGEPEVTTHSVPRVGAE